MKRFVMMVLLAITMLAAPVMFATGHVYADPPCPPNCPDTCPVDPANPYQVCLAPLPHASADSSKVKILMTIVFSVIGAISLLMVTIGGFKYISSQGDPQAVAKAKGTILYALIGVVVSISAVAIVTFVIGKL